MDRRAILRPSVSVRLWDAESAEEHSTAASCFQLSAVSGQLRANLSNLWNLGTPMYTPGMHVFVGTSGYNYPEWRGSFYPEKFSTDKMLAYYAERFWTVEINYTFYRMPNEKLLAGWSAGPRRAFRSR